MLHRLFRYHSFINQQACSLLMINLVVAAPEIEPDENILEAPIYKTALHNSFETPVYKTSVFPVPAYTRLPIKEETIPMISAPTYVKLTGAKTMTTPTITKLRVHNLIPFKKKVGTATSYTMVKKYEYLHAPVIKAVHIPQPIIRAIVVPEPMHLGSELPYFLR